MGLTFVLVKRSWIIVASALPQTFFFISSSVRIPLIRRTDFEAGLESRYLVHSVLAFYPSVIICRDFPMFEDPQLSHPLVLSVIHFPLSFMLSATSLFWSAFLWTFSNMKGPSRRRMFYVLGFCCNCFGLIISTYAVERTIDSSHARLIILGESHSMILRGGHIIVACHYTSFVYPLAAFSIKVQ